MRKDKKTGDYTDGAIFIYERTKKAAKFLLEPFNGMIWMRNEMRPEKPDTQFDDRWT